MRTAPAISASISNDGHILTAIATDSSFREIYARQIKTLGQEIDVLLVICAGRTARSVLEAVKAGQERSMSVIALTGDDGDEISDLLEPADLEIRVPSRQGCIIQETHLIIINTLCGLIEAQIFGEET